MLLYLPLLQSCTLQIYYIEVKLFEEYTEDAEMPEEEMSHTQKNKSKCRFLITENKIILDK